MMRFDNDPDTNQQDDRDMSPLWGRLALVAFGLALLVFLTAIDHQKWFELRPATGTAAAMAYASDQTPRS